jgi:TfoX/Sxy family transcriptional regulator of competence genes
MAYDENTAARARKILSGRRDVTERAMMGGLSFMVGGNMACAVSGKGGLLIRVGSDGMRDALKEPHVNRTKMGAKTMSGFVRVAPEGYRTDAALKKWVERGIAFALTLPRKAKRKPRVRGRG